MRHPFANVQVSDLQLGDILCLQGDIFADRWIDDVELEREFVVVTCIDKRRIVDDGKVFISWEHWVNTSDYQASETFPKHHHVRKIIT